MRYILALLLLFTSIASAAISPFYCKSINLTNCLGISKSMCVQASQKALELCSIKYDLTNKSHEETLEIINKAAPCSTTQFFLLTSIKQKKIKECEQLLIEAAQKEADSFNTK